MWQFPKQDGKYPWFCHGRRLSCFHRQLGGYHGLNLSCAVSHSETLTGNHRLYFIHNRYECIFIVVSLGCIFKHLWDNEKWSESTFSITDYTWLFVLPQNASLSNIWSRNWLFKGPYTLIFPHLPIRNHDSTKFFGFQLTHETASH